MSDEILVNQSMATFTLHKDKLVECPFDKNHKIAVRNQIKHIIECEHKIVSKTSVCIYNASHRMARHEFAQHIKSCPDGRQHFRDLYVSKQTNSSDIKPETRNGESIDSQMASNTQSVLQDSEEDNWDNDNCPHYSIYDTNESIDFKSKPNATQKLTKNQKKRNRKKAAIDAIASQQINSIWD